MSHVQDAPTIQREPTGATKEPFTGQGNGAPSLMGEVRGTLTPPLEEKSGEESLRLGCRGGPKKVGGRRDSGHVLQSPGWELGGYWGSQVRLAFTVGLSKSQACDSSHCRNSK